MKKRNGMSAWLITWEWSGQRAEPQKIVEILDPRISPRRVLEIVELIYQKDATLSEKINWRLGKREQPYPATFASIDGMPWEGQIICGHNPWLSARLVDDLIVEISADGEEKASWSDRYSMREVAEKFRSIRNG